MFTEGEWEATDFVMVDGERVYDIETANEVIASGVSEANARLIAAAPLMYEALKRLLIITKGNGKRTHHSLCYGLDIEAHPDCELCKLIEAERTANNALSKAEGK